MSLPLVNTAKHTVKLPGCGLDVEYRPFFVKEQKVLLQATESEDPAQIASATNDMVRACTFEKLNLEDVTSTDIEYLLLKIRSKSVGETAKVQLKCSHCEHPNEYEINLDAIEPTGGNLDEQKIKVNDSIGICFKLPTVGNLKKFMEVSGGTATDTLIATMGAAVDYVYDADAVYSSSDGVLPSIADKTTTGVEASKDSPFFSLESSTTRPLKSLVEVAKTVSPLDAFS